jgi:hypothetical protein
MIQDATLPPRKMLAVGLGKDGGEIHRLRGFVAAERRKTVDLRAWLARVVVFAKLLGKCDLECAIFEANSSGG